MRVLISGASGLLGNGADARVAKRQVTRRLRWCGARRATGEVQWDPTATARSGEARRTAMRSCIWPERTLPAAGPKSSSRKFWRAGAIGTQTLATAAAESFRRTGQPRVFVSASGVGYYGNRGDEVLTEESSAGHGISRRSLQAVGSGDGIRRARLVCAW